MKLAECHRHPANHEPQTPDMYVLCFNVSPDWWRQLVVTSVQGGPRGGGTHADTRPCHWFPGVPSPVATPPTVQSGEGGVEVVCVGLQAPPPTAPTRHYTPEPEPVYTGLYTSMNTYQYV